MATRRRRGSDVGADRIGRSDRITAGPPGRLVAESPREARKVLQNRLAEELGDAVMMLLVAGIVEGVDPLIAMSAKVEGLTISVIGDSPAGS